MQTVVIVLNKTQCLDEILERLSEAGVRATIVSSKGMAHSLFDVNKIHFIESVKILIDPMSKSNYTIFSVVEDDKVAEISRIVNDVTGGLSKSNSGIIFAVPVSYIEGIGN